MFSMSILARLGLCQSIPTRFYYGMSRSKTLSSQEVSAALRPFYFVVHPDLFHLHPTQRNVNENSLKQLNSYLESLLQQTTPGPTFLTFYLRDRGEKSCHTPKPMKSIKVKLQSSDLNVTIRSILTACQLPTDYIDKIYTKNQTKTRITTTTTKPETSFDSNMFWERRVRENKPEDDIEDRIKSVDDIDLSKWLEKNIEKAQLRVDSCYPVRVEVARLSAALFKVFHLKNIVWDCGWGISHFRGCLQSFYNLSLQFPLEVSILKDRVLIFGRQTGVSLDGQIILSAEHVRHCWLELLQNVPTYDAFLRDLPTAEENLSEVLLGIKIDHRKFQPTVMIQKYIHQLEKLTSAIYKFRWLNGYPQTFPRRLDNFQLVVECEAGPLMLSPTGQFIVPASCPAFLLVEFMSQNIDLASERLEQYERDKLLETQVCSETIQQLGLASLHKDDNVTPELMIQCCNRLLTEYCSLWSSILKGSHLRVSNFYSVLQDGEICIPWNWKSGIFK